MQSIFYLKPQGHQIWAIWVSLRLNLRWILHESSNFFLFNIEGYGEFFSGITPYEFWLSLCKIVRSSVILLLPLFRISILILLKIMKRKFKYDGQQFHPIRTKKLR
jgi:hypothetical protein